MSIINTPIHIKNTELRNRLVMPPMATAKAEQRKPVMTVWKSILLTDIS
ncbi:hypothetical protein [Sedimentibacter sp.]|nr:hypothetical protein [Sedimentibacter sp.]